MPKTDMYDQTRIKMKYLFHNEWKEKFVALSDIWKWTQNGKFKKRVNAVRDIDNLLTTCQPKERSTKHLLQMILTT